MQFLLLSGQLNREERRLQLAVRAFPFWFGFVAGKRRSQKDLPVSNGYYGDLSHFILCPLTIARTLS
ncbi:hypothetical protein [Neorhodopirellula pilleata]|uniref:Uncharacterized protein n=1 Tax=Neorhodopirellula pilleata TaxID=2714738 RepID=A0A5C6AVJ2_9BACT|nr:hypothetical protein [Neorhodopirellula pilleata]TWU04045.1 hypothetical protein Pla100_09810 [Neorhodopirellula pilleata]